MAVPVARRPRAFSEGSIGAGSGSRSPSHGRGPRVWPRGGSSCLHLDEELARPVAPESASFGSCGVGGGASSSCLSTALEDSAAGPVLRGHSGGDRRLDPLGSRPPAARKVREDGGVRGAEVTDERSSFAGAAEGFSELVSQVLPDQWASPALGSWDVRGLVGHASRALLTLETYLSTPASGPLLEDPADYFVAVIPDTEDEEERRRRDVAIAERGRSAGEALGDDPGFAVRTLVDRVLDLLEATADDAVLGTPAGAMTLAAYLPTRTFELAVHSLDLARALGVETPASLQRAVATSCVLAGRVASRRRNAAELLLAMTGRGSPGERVSVV